MRSDPLATQLANELLATSIPWSLFGSDVEDLLRERIRSHTLSLVATLRSDEDDRVTADTVQCILNLLWPGDDPPVEWWDTPLGQACARSLGSADAQAVTHAVAAAMLGVHRGTVAQLVHRGTLDRHPDGGITRASVLARKHRLRAGPSGLN